MKKKNWGLSGVRLAITDQHAGLTAAIRRCLQGAVNQRGGAPFDRVLLAMIPRTHEDFVAALFRTAFAGIDIDGVSASLDQVAPSLAERRPTAAARMDTANVEVLAQGAFPVEHWRKISSTAPLQRVDKDIRLRSRVVGILPKEASAIGFVGTVLADLHDDWISSDRHNLSEGSMVKR